MNLNLRKVAPWSFVLMLAILACGASSRVTPIPTVAPATDTSIPTNTPTRISTSTKTLAPTETPAPPTSTFTPTQPPAGLGETVTYGSFEFAVLDVYRHDRIVPGGAYYYTPKKGYMIIDLVVKIKNLGTNPPNIKWGDLYVIESDGDVSRTDFAGFMRAGNNERVDPLAIPYDSVSLDARLEFTYSIWLRVIYIIKLKPEQIVQFRIQDSPLVEFTVYK